MLRLERGQLGEQAVELGVAHEGRSLRVVGAVGAVEQFAQFGDPVGVGLHGRVSV